MSTSHSPTALKWWIGNELRSLREKAGLTRDEAAKVIRVTVGTISHAENGRYLLRPLELQTLLQLYGVSDRNDVFQELRTRAKQGQDWKIDAETFSSAFDLFLSLESASVQLDSWDAQIIPGLFQTPSYISSIIKGNVANLSDKRIEERIELRLARQAGVLKKTGPKVKRVISEAALRLPVGDNVTMTAQLEHLLSLMENPNIEIQILPLSEGFYGGLSASFTILAPPQGLEDHPGLVHVEDYVQSHYYEKEAHVLMYRAVLARIREKTLTPKDTPAFIRQVMKEFEK